MPHDQPPGPAGPPAQIVIYPAPRDNRWNHSLAGPAGIVCGFLDLPASATPDQARHAAETLLTRFGRTYWNIQLTIRWHAPSPEGWINGEVQQAELTPEA